MRRNNNNDNSRLTVYRLTVFIIPLRYSEPVALLCCSRVRVQLLYRHTMGVYRNLYCKLISFSQSFLYMYCCHSNNNNAYKIVKPRWLYAEIWFMFGSFRLVFTRIIQMINDIVNVNRMYIILCVHVHVHVCTVERVFNIVVPFSNRLTDCTFAKIQIRPYVLCMEIENVPEWSSIEQSSTVCVYFI